MTDAPDADPVVKAREATSKGDWVVAYDALVAHRDVLGSTELALLADAAYASGHLDEAIAAWERAYSLSLKAGETLSAAAAAVHVAMHLLFDTALMAPVRGWIKRAEALLPPDAETPVHAWLAVVRNYERLLAGDFPTARQWARRAVEIGTMCDPAAAAVGRIAEARGLILDGDVQTGRDLLDEAGTAILTGELEPLATGIVYCELVCTLQALGQYELAEEWTTAMERWHPGQPVGSIHGRCRVHRAEILRFRGNTPQAEHEAAAALEELRPYLRRELGWPLAELGRIRLLRGDLPGAKEALLAAQEMAWDPQPWLALLQLAEGHAGEASASIKAALQQPLNVPSKELPPNTELRRAPLLEAQVQIEVEAGDLDSAELAVNELKSIAASFQSKALLAGATLAQARLLLARGQAPDAVVSFREALHLWGDVGAPFETGQSRMGLALALQMQGNEERARSELNAARAIFERIGATGLAATTAHALQPHTLEGARQSIRGSADGQSVLRAEGDYWSLTFERQTVRLRDLKGLHYLARLLREPEREFHVLDLVALENGTDSSRRTSDLALNRDTSAGTLLDPQAKDAYRRRLREIEEDLEEAQAMGDSERVFQAQQERDFLARELARAVGLGGRDRLAGSASERARASVTRAVRQAMGRIGDLHPAAARHLNLTIRTGTYCSYQPDPRLPSTWEV